MAVGELATVFLWLLLGCAGLAGCAWGLMQLDEVSDIGEDSGEPTGTSSVEPTPAEPAVVVDLRDPAPEPVARRPVPVIDRVPA